jgi:hypothetical protein
MKRQLKHAYVNRHKKELNLARNETTLTHRPLILPSMNSNIQSAPTTLNLLLH